MGKRKLAGFKEVSADRYEVQFIVTLSEISLRREMADFYNRAIIRPIIGRPAKLNYLNMNKSSKILMYIRYKSKNN